MSETRTRRMGPGPRQTRLGALLVVVLATVSLAACEAVRNQPSGDQDLCTRTRLDQVPDVAFLFADPAVGCVIVAWDTEMRGAGVLADGGIGTPGALAAAARTGGFDAPCETTVDPQQSSVSRGWFLTRFGALDPAAQYWGVTLFLRAPLPDGINPGCANVMPPP